MNAGRGLADARSAMSSGIGELRSGEAGEARSEFARANDRLTQATGYFGHPGYRVLARLPFIGADARAARSLAAAAGLLSGVGTELAALAHDLSGEHGAIGDGLIENGRLRLDQLQSAGEVLVSVHRDVVRATEVLAATPAPRLGVLRDAMSAAHHGATGAEETLRKVSAVAGAATDLFGGDGPRRYLLAFQAPSEARGSGGLFGLFAILEMNDGAIKIGNISRPPEALLASDAPQIVPVEAPDWFVSKYESEGSLWNSSEVNLSPHFPTVAAALLRMYEQVEDLRLDGVLALDPNALASLMAATGPIDTPGLGTITSTNAERSIMRDSYVELTPEEQNVNLGLLLDELFARLRAGDVDGAAFLQGVGEAASGGNLKFYVRDADSADALSIAEADGDFTDFGPIQQMVWHNSSSVSKIDWFLHRTLETVVRLQPDGSAQVTTRILVENRAPDGPPSLLLGGLAEGYPAGSNRMRLDMFIPRGARLTSCKDGETEVQPERGEEAGYPTAWLNVIMGPRSERLFEITYEVDRAVDVEDAEVFGFTLYPHAAVRPDGYLLTIYPPDGYRLRKVGSFEEPSEFVQITGLLAGPSTLEVELARL